MSLIVNSKVQDFTYTVPFSSTCLLTLKICQTKAENIACFLLTAAMQHIIKDNVRSYVYCTSR